MTLEQMIREAAGNGRLDGLTLWLQPDGNWQAGLRARKSWRDDRTGKSVGGFNVCVDADPVAALLGALHDPSAKDDDGIFA